MTMYKTTKKRDSDGQLLYLHINRDYYEGDSCLLGVTSQWLGK